MFISGVPGRWFECNRWTWGRTTAEEANTERIEEQQLLQMLRRTQVAYISEPPARGNEGLWADPRWGKFLSRPVLGVSINRNRATITLGKALPSTEVRRFPDAFYANLWVDLFAKEHGRSSESTCAHISYVDRDGLPVQDGDGQSESDCCMAVL